MSIVPEIQPKPTTLIGGRTFDWGSKTFVMGIINVTPDSFSGDGILSGDGPDIDLIVGMARNFEEWGCDIIDVGGESTRPAFTYGEAAPTSEAEELDRVIPAIEAIRSAVRVPVSVDTYKAPVARAAIEAGASLVNDVWAFTRDSEMARVVAEAGVPVVLMHNQTHTRYRDVVMDVIARLAELREGAMAEGIGADRIILDPGIGFGKTPGHNLKLLRRLDEFQSLGAPILMGTSRKSTIGKILDLPPDDRIEGTAAAIALSIAGGADIVRVHDVREMVRVARMADAVVRGWKPAEPVSDD
jgi:dihydropteroate synthase